MTWHYCGNQKLSIGGVTEKIISAYHLMLSEQPNEDAEMSKCKSAIKRIRKLEKDVETAYTTGKSQRSYCASYFFVASIYYKVLKLCRDL